MLQYVHLVQFFRQIFLCHWFHCEVKMVHHHYIALQLITDLSFIVIKWMNNCCSEESNGSDGFVRIYLMWHRTWVDDNYNKINCTKIVKKKCILSRRKMSKKGHTTAICAGNPRTMAVTPFLNAAYGPTTQMTFSGALFFLSSIWGIWWYLAVQLAYFKILGNLFCTWEYSTDN